MELIYFDANAILDLFPPQGETLQTREWQRLLKLEVRRRRYSVLVSGLLLQELVGDAEKDWHRFRRVIRYLHWIGGRRILLDGTQLIRKEIRKGRRLRPRERFYSKSEVSELWASVTNRSYLREISELAKAAAKRHDNEERLLREAAKSQMLPNVPPGSSLTLELRKWWGTDPRARVLNFAASSIPELSREIAGVELPSDYPVWSLPSLGRYYAYFVARLWLRLGENQRIRPSDLADPFHYVLAGYADTFVTTDSRLRDVDAAMPFGRVRILTFTEFAADLRP